jgi:hypothetical protein
MSRIAVALEWCASRFLRRRSGPIEPSSSVEAIVRLLRDGPDETIVPAYGRPGPRARPVTLKGEKRDSSP